MIYNACNSSDLIYNVLPGSLLGILPLQLGAHCRNGRCLAMHSLSTPLRKYADQNKGSPSFDSMPARSRMSRAAVLGSASTTCSLAGALHSRSIRTSMPVASMNVVDARSRTTHATPSWPPACSGKPNGCYSHFWLQGPGYSRPQLAPYYQKLVADARSANTVRNAHNAAQPTPSHPPAE